MVHGRFRRLDPDGQHVRLNVRSVLIDSSTGALIAFKYTGIVTMTPGPAAVLGGLPGAKTTEFGDICKNCPFALSFP